jgi:hypothetical protein
LTMLYRSTDRLCRCGAPMKNLAHSASLDSDDKNAPLNNGIKQLERESFRRNHNGLCDAADTIAITIADVKAGNSLQSPRNLPTGSGQNLGVFERQDQSHFSQW